MFLLQTFIPFMFMVKISRGYNNYYATMNVTNGLPGVMNIQ